MAEPATEWRDRVVRALGTVVVVGLVIGGVLGAVAYSAARAAGLAGGEAQATAPVTANETTGGQPTTSQVSPSPSPATAEPTPRKQQAKSGEGQPPKSHKTSKRQRANDKRRAGRRAGHHAELTLAVSPRQVHRMGRIHLMGRYPGHGGARLVVQRFEGGHWARFPVSATVRGGRFRTWVASGHRGVNRFRVVDAATRRASAPVTVRVR